jgi:isopenicillin-N epimerase
VRDAFALDPSITHLNHGSFGAVPRVVTAAQQRVRDRAEANPMRFFRVDSPGLKAEARAVGAEFLGVGADDIALVRNVTASAAVVLASLAEQGRLGPGDVVLVGRPGYESVRRTVARWCASTGASYEVVDWAVGASDEDVVRAFRDRLARGGVRLVVIDQITSPTGAVLPAREVCEAARAAGALSMIDAAHVPGHVESRPASSGADFWTGTWHKWGFAPRGTTALWASEAERGSLQPITTSWNDGQPFPWPFDTAGTDDSSSWFALDAALAFWRDAGGPAIAERSRAMLDEAAVLVADAIGPRPDVALPVNGAPCMRLVALPVGVAETEEDADRLYEALGAELVEAQVVAYDGQGWLRLSCAPYNEPEDYQRLADVLPKVLASHPA